jgi:DNA-binding NtrC family response regulator
VNDDDDALFLIRHAIERAFPRAELMTRRTADDALEVLKAQTFDAVVTDNRMPGTSGIAMVEIIRAKDPGLVIIMLTAAENVRDEALAAGATAFLASGDWIELRQKLVELLAAHHG